MLHHIGWITTEPSHAGVGVYDGAESGCLIFREPATRLSPIMLTRLMWRIASSWRNLSALSSERFAH